MCFEGIEAKLQFYCETTVNRIVPIYTEVPKNVADGLLLQTKEISATDSHYYI